jgi:hypothetical protein
MGRLVLAAVIAVLACARGGERSGQQSAATTTTTTASTIALGQDFLWDRDDTTAIRMQLFTHVNLYRNRPHL